VGDDQIMARRGGKAANRRARQQRRNRPAATPPALTPAPASEVVEQTMPAVAATPAAAVTPARPASPVPAPARIIAHGSALSAHAREEYHYVGRDLRNIGILVVIMFAVLAAATLAINVL
jgi:2-keto-4-pentenoate hydratase/2-oxohepta-3-ene-1,7-dioic acid hydratase in catechol pathway